jgi:hypothetical protein
MSGLGLPDETVGLRLCRHRGDDLILYEGIRFAAGRDGADTVLRRAALAGRVEVGGEIQDHFADVLDDNGDIIETVSLDRGSFNSLKNHWMRCKVDRP